ncbi:MAG: hypothetical protein ACLQHW_02740 [bacterium]
MMDEEGFDFENLKVYQKALEYVDTPNPELRTLWEQDPKRTTLPLTLDEVLSQVQSYTSRKVLFWGERAGEISSYVAGWLASKGRAVIVLDGANRFDPYTVSSLARGAWIPPKRLLKSIRIARAFTCYQMATLMGEQLTSLLRREGATELRQKPWVILLGPLTTFLDEDVSEREVRPLFERSLRKIEGMVSEGVPFLLFQSSGFSENPPFAKGGLGGLRNSKRVYLMKRLFQFSNLVWRISLEDKEPRMILEKGFALNIIENCKLQNEKYKFERGNLTVCW